LATVVPASLPVAPTTSSMSATIASKSCVRIGWKTIAARPLVFICSSTSIVTQAVEMANSRSGAGPLIFGFPRRMSNRPISGATYP
jgi:hypothetical protein